MFCFKKFYKLLTSLKNISTKPDTKSYQNQYDIFGGKGVIYTTPQSNGNYQLRVWIPEEKTYYRISLHTKIFNDAVALAEEEMLNILSKIKNGHKIAGSSWEELCELFLKHQEDRVSTGRITKERLTTLKSQINRHIIPFIGGKLRLSELTNNSFLDYGMFRRKNNPDVKDITIKNEYSTINSILKYGFRYTYLPFEHAHIEDITIRGDISRRPSFEVSEYQILYKKMRSWVKEAKFEENRYYRQLLRDFILLDANTFMRFGEILRLKWEMVNISIHNNKNGMAEKFLNIALPAELSKVRKKRTIFSRGGEYADRIKTYSKHIQPSDFIFSTLDGKLIAEKKMYALWKEVIDYAGLSENIINKKLTFYSLRHFGITCRLYSKVPIHELAELAGTSVKEIENRYAHLDMSKMVESASKSFKIDKNGIITPD